nr:MAG TPA: hypothetical protein [Caudoviricetes sp.]
MLTVLSKHYLYILKKLLYKLSYFVLILEQFYS